MKTLQELAAQVRAVNAANGWGADWQLSAIGGYLGLIHTEVTEAYQALPTRRDEEFADIIIRSLDLCELIQPGLIAECGPWGLDHEDFLPPELPWQQLAKASPAAAYMQIHGAITDVHETYRKRFIGEDEKYLPLALVSGLTNVMAVTAACAKAFGHGGLEVVVLAKIEKNRTRGHRHGGRRT